MKRGVKKGVRRIAKTSKESVRGSSSRKKSKGSGRKSTLSSAIKDLESEIRLLSREKADLKKENQKTTSSLEVSRDQERMLQQKIAGIIERQARLNQKKKSLQVRIDRDADKINKISKIKSEISDI